MDLGPGIGEPLRSIRYVPTPTVGSKPHVKNTLDPAAGAQEEARAAAPSWATGAAHRLHNPQFLCLLNLIRVIVVRDSFLFLETNIGYYY